MYMPSSASRQDESNSALWLATWAGKMEPSCQHQAGSWIAFSTAPYSGTWFHLKRGDLVMNGYRHVDFFVQCRIFKRVWLALATKIAAWTVYLLFKFEQDCFVEVCRCISLFLYFCTHCMNVSHDIYCTGWYQTLSTNGTQTLFWLYKLAT